ncbi:hypothetical protein Tco_0892973 [Tanacetum coccineum]|uniref:Uncharacterized protein n=1 Tax=Tanacetum coccineum TaxID=301880 RepID=A0ABQ5C7N9_9ASTR
MVNIEQLSQGEVIVAWHHGLMLLVELNYKRFLDSKSCSSTVTRCRMQQAKESLCCSYIINVSQVYCKWYAKLIHASIKDNTASKKLILLDSGVHFDLMKRKQVEEVLGDVQDCLYRRVKDITDFHLEVMSLTWVSDEDVMC